MLTPAPTPLRRLRLGSRQPSSPCTLALVAPIVGICTLSMRRSYLAGELFVLFFLAPGLAYVLLQQPFALALLATVFTLTILCQVARDDEFDKKTLWVRPPWGILRSLLLIRLPIVAACMVGLVLALDPETLFSTPREKPLVWLVVSIGYPILSVIPQEIIYRSWMFHRYAPLFQSVRARVWMSTISFAYVHIVMDNPLAVLLTLVGGLLFSSTFVRTRSLTAVVVEHAIYGWLALTIGLGAYFYHAGGPMRHPAFRSLFTFLDP